MNLEKSQVDTLFRYWRVRIFYTMFFGYAFFYLTRKSFTFAMPGMIEDLGLDKAELGILVTVFSLTYGFSKFISGILSDRSNARYFMGIGLMLTGIVNILFGLSSTVTLFALLWGFNGWFQGFGWPPCARLLTHWYSKAERGAWWSSWNVCHNVGGGIVVPLIAGGAALYFDWRTAMYIPGVICILVGFWIINRLRDTPESLGLPTVEVWRGDLPQEVQKKEEKKRASTKEILFEHVLSNSFIWLLAIAYIFVYMIRFGLYDWSPLFMIEEKGYSKMAAYSSLFFFEAGGFCGNLIAGWTSDRLFNAQRAPVNVLFSLGIFLSLFAFWFFPGGSIFFDYGLMFLMGFFVFGPQMMIGIAAAEQTDKSAAATANGFVGWFGYVGTAIAGAPLGFVAEQYGWSGFYMILAGGALLTLLFLVPMWPRERRPATIQA